MKTFDLHLVKKLEANGVFSNHFFPDRLYPHTRILNHSMYLQDIKFLIDFCIHNCNYNSILFIEDNMIQDVYHQLAEHLDQLPGGFPASGSGVEFRMLKRLFTPEEAELTLHLTLLPESTRVIAYRANIPQEEAEHRLTEMTGKGNILCFSQEVLMESLFPKVPRWLKKILLLSGIRNKNDLLYCAANFFVGIWEFQLNNLEPDFVRDMDEYWPFLIKEWVKFPQLRTIPVGRSLDNDVKILPHEKAEELIRRHKRILVANCICRTETPILGEGCKKPLETCLIFGMPAEYYERNGLGRMIDLNEALTILKKAEKAGLVLQPSNYKEALSICCCCSCCCTVLRNIKKMDKPARLVPSFFVTQVNPENCDGCGVCVKRCPMDALTLMDGKVSQDQSRCIGCGICIPTCPECSLTLIRKPRFEQPKLPKDILWQGNQIARTRGVIGPLHMAKLMINSKVDRFQAPG